MEVGSNSFNLHYTGNCTSNKKCWIFRVDIHTLLRHLHFTSRLDVGYTQ